MGVGLCWLCVCGVGGRVAQVLISVLFVYGQSWLPEALHVQFYLEPE